MSILRIIFWCILVSGISSCFAVAQTNNWTHFRGSKLDGISSEKIVPVLWNDSTHILWKSPIHGKGWSSPVVFGNQIWCTTATEDGKQMYGICADMATGKILFDIKLFEPEKVYGKHGINTYATPTPCIEDGFVYLHFGTYGTACLRTNDGSVVWKRTDLNCDHVQGPGSSPILYKDLLILHLEGVDVQYLVALDKHTGKTVWQKERPRECYTPLEPIGKKAYITPIIIQVDGKDVLISNGAAVCIAYDPNTGEEIWRIVQGEDSTIAMPVYENGVVYFYTSFVTASDGTKRAELLAVNPKGTGNIRETNILWRLSSPILQLLTPLIKDGFIYTVDTQNMLECIDAKTGSIVWSKRMKSKYNASPVFAGGNIYFTSVNGETLVIKPGNKLDVVAENKLKGEVYATPAIAQESIILRTGNMLYRIR